VAEQLKVEQDTPQKKLGAVTNWEFKQVTEVLAGLCGKTIDVSQIWEGATVLRRPATSVQCRLCQDTTLKAKP
jgi:hypothetical protein